MPGYATALYTRPFPFKSELALFEQADDSPLLGPLIQLTS